MPYKNAADNQRAWRISKRNHKHPSWRQVYVDCHGMCVFRSESGELCGCTDALEFHEIFTEAKGGELKFQQRALLCLFHHYVEHVHDGFVGKLHKRPYPSRLHEDVEWEIARAGGYEAWLERFGIISRDGEYTPPVGGYDDSPYQEEYRQECLAGAGFSAGR